MKLSMSLKLVMGVYFARAFNDRLGGKPLIINTVDPGFCKSSIGRHRKGVESFIFGLLSKTIGRTPEEGSRQLVWAAVGGEDQKENLRGAFVDMASRIGGLSDYGESEAGRIVQNKIWVRTSAYSAKASSVNLITIIFNTFKDNLIEELTKISPNVQQNVQKYLQVFM